MITSLCSQSQTLNDLSLCVSLNLTSIHADDPVSMYVHEHHFNYDHEQACFSSILLPQGHIPHHHRPLPLSDCDVRPCCQ